MQETGQHGDSTQESAAAKPWMIALAVLWICGFSYRFYTAVLPNASTADKTLTRTDVAEVLFSDLSFLNPLAYPNKDIASGWEFLPQRLPHLITALVLWVSAWLIGRTLTQPFLTRVSLLKSEQLVIEAGTGMSLLTTWTLVTGLAGFPDSPAVSVWLLGPSFCCGVWLTLAKMRRKRTQAARPPVTRAPRYLVVITGFIGLIFVMHLLLGAVSPPFDFDVREYHLQGPKEWYLAGRITELRHNVYTSFPFLSEMVSLSAMLLRDDWWEGALSGKLSLSGFQLLSALGTYAIATRWGNRSAGLIAATAVLTTPWITRISVIAYAEGAISFYLTAAVMVALIAGQLQESLPRKRVYAVAGLLAGSAMASKYPGLITVIIPVGIYLAWRSIRLTPLGQQDGRREFLRAAICYVIGTLIAMAPWMLRNAVAEGNPVYPLAWSVFGAEDWSAEMEAKWQAGHSAPDHDLSAVGSHIHSIAIGSDWQSGILFALAVPSALLMYRSNQHRWIWLMLLWLITSWWALTHRIDRFWIPMIPLLAVSAGALWNVVQHKGWRSLILAVIVTGATFNYGLARTDLIGRHAGLTDLRESGKAVVRPDLEYLNKVLNDDARVLMVGEAEVFDARFYLVYNTVFDESIFEQWTSAAASGVTPAEQSLKSAPEIKDILAKNRITHIFVNWAEILRYRKTYGYSEFVHPDRFQQLQQLGILGDRSVTGGGKLNDADHQILRSWPGGDGLIHGNGVTDLYVLYRVKSANSGDSEASP